MLKKSYTSHRIDPRSLVQVIVTSWLFPEARFSMERLLAMEEAVGRERLVVDIRYI